MRQSAVLSNDGLGFPLTNNLPYTICSFVPLVLDWCDRWLVICNCVTVVIDASTSGGLIDGG